MKGDLFIAFLRNRSSRRVGRLQDHRQAWDERNLQEAEGRRKPCSAGHEGGEGGAGSIRPKLLRREAGGMRVAAVGEP